MQTLTIDIQDGFLQDFLSIVEHYKGKIEIKKDSNLEYDTYFYDRKKQLQQDIHDIDIGAMDMLSQEQYNEELKSFFVDLKSKYEN